MASRVSERFSGADSDITLQSTDGVLFKVHRKNLEMHSEGFVPEDLVTSSTSKEIVPLSETSAVLELLFQYMYRQPQPDLGKVDFSVLAGLAEAAEKYQVYPALEICKVRMRDSIPHHALEVLNFAARHKHPEIMDEAARETIDLPMEDIYHSLSPEVYIAWTRYHHGWLEALNRAYTCRKPTAKHYSVTLHTSEPCAVWTECYAVIAHSFRGNVVTLKHLDEVFSPSKMIIKDSCGDCEESVSSWRDTVGNMVQHIPRFSTFI